MSRGPRIGQGWDAHRLVPGRPLVLGGVRVPCERGLEGHSDGDVLLHAVASALLGALGAGDLGRHFPSSDARLRGVASGELLAQVVSMVRERGLELVNLDATVVAQAPRLAPFAEAMEEGIAKLLGTSRERVNVKITSSDGLGSIGRGEGMAASAVVLLAPAERPATR
ncbi:MAG TPA: 2-C-methyl-D-erythritol 2,4-cyclodiphosphate synthase [Deltaproteobacteria bacterium]|jgi:2-C-methyl-D-erythritol 2,4-cyclodiphosphate synthase|nr:2-C-methyl-D-erythritol 2,4-cyclodiphosphate synthase [Deltaproteobacteria bacterium]